MQGRPRPEGLRYAEPGLGRLINLTKGRGFSISYDPIRIVNNWELTVQGVTVYGKTLSEAVSRIETLGSL